MSGSAATAAVSGLTTRRLVSCGLVAGPLFVVTFLVQGTLKGSGYDALRHPVSSLALGDHGWVQTANFLICGLLTIAFAVGLWRAGVFQRLAVTIGWAWMFALALRVLRRT
ncbi:DUF998 domain-containing protein [Kribbella sp. NPDC023972]|uniref:DUF998 domain-containing protein n=1 Tax=Kribbella sp. NPDC023972 TaxID=3154795 RepID=UPI0033FEC116